MAKVQIQSGHEIVPGSFKVREKPGEIPISEFREDPNRPTQLERYYNLHEKPDVTVRVLNIEAKVRGVLDQWDYLMKGAR